MRSLLAILSIALLAACGDDAPDAKGVAEGKGGSGGNELPDLCEGIECNHGRCEITGDAPSCICDESFAGESCDVCAPRRTGQSCESCIGNFAGPRCDACAPGWAGAECDRCADGHEGDDCQSCSPGWSRDGDRCVATCESLALDCGSFGSCDDADGSPACVCDEGRAGPNCEVCARGYHDPDEDGVCTRFCGGDGGLVCVHGTCDDATGPATCTCEPEWRGERCDECEEGLQDNDRNGSCLPSCETAELLCAVGLVCDDSGGEAACGCRPGFDLEDERCVWRAGPRDPEFVEGIAWIFEGEVEHFPEDGGRVRYDSGVRCDYGKVSQTFAFDSFERVGLAAFEVRGHSSRWQNGGLTLRANGGDYLLDSLQDTPRLLCLGEDAYREKLTAEVGRFGHGNCFGDVASVDSFRLVAVDESVCPAPGTVHSGDFQSAYWKITNSSVAAGVSSTRGHSTLRLIGGSVCDEARMTSLVSIPSTETVRHPAIEILVNGRGRLALLLAGAHFGTVASATVPEFGPWQRMRLCLPTGFGGTTQPFALALRGGSGTCTYDAPDSEISVSSVRVVDESGCDGDVPGGDFEYADDVHSFGYFSSNAGSGKAFVDRAPGAAHRGQGALRIDYEGGDTYVALLLRMSDVERPAIRAWVRGEEGAPLLLSLSGTEYFSPPSTWTQVSTCLDSASERIVTNLLTLRSPTSAVQPPGSVWIDDIEIIDSPDC